MKIALLTIWHERNYGAEMQAYATVRALRELGHEVEVIDFRLSDGRKLSFNGRIGNLIKSFSPAEKEIRAFWRRNIPTTQRYHSITHLQNNPPQADLYLVGSDQVWNPAITRALAPAFFLNFGTDNVKRAAYASSFGTNSWSGSQELTDFIRTQLHKFDKVSCREKTGVDILKQHFAVDAKYVVDPTLLHKDYRELVDKPTEQNTLLFYPLSTDSTDLELESYSHNLARRLQLEWRDAKNEKRILRSITWERNSIEQWISSIASARLVVTRSFHGLAFSLIYHRQFIIIINSERSCRITDLLAQLGLTNRCFRSIAEAEAIRPWEHPIDYAKVDSLLLPLKTESWNFLKALSAK